MGNSCAVAGRFHRNVTIGKEASLDQAPTNSNYDHSVSGLRQSVLFSSHDEVSRTHMVPKQ